MTTTEYLFTEHLLFHIWLGRQTSCNSHHMVRTIINPILQVEKLTLAEGYDLSSCLD